jgi:hypothetical protein
VPTFDTGEITMSRGDTIKKRDMVTVYSVFVKSLKRIERNIKEGQNKEALVFIEKTLDVLSKVDDPELKRE